MKTNSQIYGKRLFLLIISFLSLSLSVCLGQQKNFLEAGSKIPVVQSVSIYEYKIEDSTEIVFDSTRHRNEAHLKEEKIFDKNAKIIREIKYKNKRISSILDKKYENDTLVQENYDPTYDGLISKKIHSYPKPQIKLTRYLYTNGSVETVFTEMTSHGKLKREAYINGPSDTSLITRCVYNSDGKLWAREGYFMGKLNNGTFYSYNQEGENILNISVDRHGEISYISRKVKETSEKGFCEVHKEYQWFSKDKETNLSKSIVFSNDLGLTIKKYFLNAYHDKVWTVKEYVYEYFEE